MDEPDKDALLAEFRAAGALLEGHFILSSGRRSAFYLQCARVLMDPLRAERLIGLLAARVGVSADLVVAPAMGGIIVGYELARQLKLPSIFTERVDGRFTLRRGFAIRPGARVLIAEDVVTTGLSTRECAQACEEQGGKVVGAACLVDRSDGGHALDKPLVSLLRVSLPTFAPEELPDELAALPAVKPGSRAQV